MKISKWWAKKKKQSFSIPRHWGYYLAVIVVAIIASHYYLDSVNNRYDKLYEAKTTTEAQKLNNELAHNLNLRIASEAKYNSNAIAEVKSLGNEDGVHQATFRYSVLVDRLTEYGLLMKPTSPPPAGGYPVVILCHSYVVPVRYSTTIGYTDEMKFYAKAGFIVVKPDYRGQGLSASSGQPEGAYYSMAYNTDIMSLITAMRKTPGVNKDKINLWGHSLGAYIALRVAVQSRDVKSLVLLSGPVDSLTRMYEDYSPPSQRGNRVAQKAAEKLFMKHGEPLVDSPFWANASPINYVDNLNARVQIHVGAKDDVVPPVFSADLDQALTKAGKAHGYYVYQNGTHGLINERPLIWDRSLTVLSPKS